MTGIAYGTAEITAAAEPARATVTVSAHPRGGLALTRVALVSPTYPHLRIKTWPATAVQVPLVVENAAGVSLCGLVPVTVAVADSALARVQQALAPGAPCVLTLEPRAAGSTWLRVSAVGRADSLEIRLVRPQFTWTFRRPEAKVAGTVGTWEVEVRDEDGSVAGVPVGFSYQLPYDSRNGSGSYATATVQTDGAGLARFQQAVAASTSQSGFFRNGLAGSSWSSGPGGQVRVTVRTSADSTVVLTDDRSIMPGAGVALRVQVRRCTTGPQVYDSACGHSPATAPVRLVDRTCPDNSSVRDELAAVLVDAYGNATTTAPTMLAETGAITPVQLHEYVFATSSISFTGSTTDRYSPSKAAYAKLAEGVDSARVTVSYAGIPDRTVDVVRDTVGVGLPPCGQ
jgi:hypothetical protein